MLINFSVTNYGPIKACQTLSLLADTTDSKLLQNTFTPKAKKKNLIRSLVMYGPNASGKTTLIKALKFLDEFVLTSHKKQLYEKLDVIPFKLDSETIKQSSEFEIDLIANDGIRYVYGLSCTSEYITKEWLFYYPKGREKKLFHRKYDEAKKKYVYLYSIDFLDKKSAKDHWETETKNNELFLSLAVQRNNKQLRPVFDWFSNTLRVVGLQDILNNYTKELFFNDKLKAIEIVNFMQQADLGITDINITKEPISIDNLSKNMPLELKKIIANDFKGHKQLNITFVHTIPKDNMVMELSEEEESDGTQAMFAFAGPWIDVIENNRVLIVDELDKSLHPLVVHQLVQLFHQQTQQKNKQAQLIFTTHDASLLNQKILRRDQVWFLEKNQAAATELYSLADIDGVNDNTSFEKAYLNGRYGGIPFMEDLSIDGK